MATAETKIDREIVRQLNLYEVLQVSAKASPEVVHAAYRALAREYHPDVNNTPQAARMMRQLNAAYRVLSDPQRRAKYDAQRAHLWRVRSAANGVRSSVTSVAGSAPTAVTTPSGRRIVQPSGYVRPVWRVGRLAALVLVLMLMMGAMLFVFWLVATVLDDDPQLMLRAVISLRQA
jgi:DnaJ-like protein